MGIKCTSKVIILLLFVTFAGVASIDAKQLRIGFVTDIHYGDDNDYTWPDMDGRRFWQAEDKVDAVIAHFVAVNCNAIVSLGDFIEEQNNDVAAIIDNFNGTDDIHRLHCIGNHDAEMGLRTVASFLSAVGQDGEDNGGEYFRYDIPDSNISIFILNGSYYKWVADDNSIEYYQQGDDNRPVHGEGGNYVDRDGSALISRWWLSPAQISWLDASLTAADAEGRYSIICSHQCLGADTINRNFLQNSDEVRAILQQHRVVAVFNGHDHANSFVKLELNALGRPILYCTLHGCVDGDFDDGLYAHHIFDVDDNTGNWSITGFNGGRALSNKYVATDGSAAWDDANGSGDNTTFCSLATAMANAAAGDVVWIKNGTAAGAVAAYDLSAGPLDVNNSGGLADNKKIKFIGYDTTVDTSSELSDMDYGQEFYGGAYGAYAGLSTARWANFDGGDLANDLVTLSDKDNIEFRNIEFHNTSGNHNNGIQFFTSPRNDSFTNCKFHDLYQVFGGNVMGVLLEDCYIGALRADQPITDFCTGGFSIGCVWDGAIRGPGNKTACTFRYGTVQNSLLVNGEYSYFCGPWAGVLVSCTLYNASVAAVGLDSIAASIHGHNNILMPAHGASGYAVYMNGAGGSIKLSHNCLYAVDGPLAVGQEVYSIKADSDFTLDDSLSANPQFVDPNNYDFRLKASSPCIKAGKPILGSSSDTGRSNIGAYESDGVSFCSSADLNGDCIVNFADFSKMADEWLGDGTE
ncbi:MAG: metallophosphoesterase [Planctomycetota bacterium]|jgi:hypothetical protein